jgi:hypothetical protein
LEPNLGTEVSYLSASRRVTDTMTKKQASVTRRRLSSKPAADR